MLKYILISLGMISLTIGLIGIVTPGLPTTPFLLLTAYLFAKSSPKLHERLLNNKLTGAYINRIGNGLSLKARIFTILFMWTMISITVFIVFKNNQTMQYVMVGLGCIGTIAQLIVLRKRKPKEKTLPIEESVEEEAENIQSN